MHNIKYYRVKKEMTQAELAERFGVSQPYIAQLERITRKPSYAILTEMIELFGATAGQILGTEPVDDGS